VELCALGKAQVFELLDAYVVVPDKKTYSPWILLVNDAVQRRSSGFGNVYKNGGFVVHLDAHVLCVVELFRF